MFLTHGQLGFFQGRVGFVLQSPHLLLQLSGVVRHTHQLGGQHFTFAVEDLIPFLGELQLLFHADQVAAGWRYANAWHYFPRGSTV